MFTRSVGARRCPLASSRPVKCASSSSSSAAGQNKCYWNVREKENSCPGACIQTGDSLNKFSLKALLKQNHHVLDCSLQTPFHQEWSALRTYRIKPTVSGLYWHLHSGLTGLELFLQKQKALNRIKKMQTSSEEECGSLPVVNAFSCP